MNKWHKKTIWPTPTGGTVQDAMDLIADGDCVNWSTHGSEPKVFFSHLHTIAPGWAGDRVLEHHQPV